MRKRKLLSLLVLLITAVTGAWASIGGTGSQGDPYTISSAADWNEFCASFSTKDYAGEYVKLTCDIPTAAEKEAGTKVTQMAAETYQGNYFKGTFDGGDYTITVDLGKDWEKYTCGLFRYLDGATIQNLKVDGTVCAYGWKWRGGFAGVTYGNCTFENCTSKVTINAGTYMNNHSSGGFVGCARGNITFTKCVFQGQLSGAYATHWGGFVGQKDNDDNTVTLNKCLFAPQNVNVSATSSATFVRTDDADGINFGSGDNGAYCTQFLGTQQGTLASTTEPTAGNGIYKSATVNGQTCYVVATVSGIEEEYIADGSSHTLTPVLTCMGTQLSKDNDYTIADEANLTYSTTGDYSVTFNAAGSTYKGSCTVSYKVISPNGNCGENVTWSLDLSSGVMTISGTGAMANYSSLSEIPWYSNRNVITSVVIGEGVTTIGNGAFYQCNNLASVSIPASVTSIGEETFAESGSSTGMAVTIATGSALETIGNKAFLWSNLTSIILPASVTSIGRMAFYGCSKLATVTVYAEPTCTLGNSAFNDCSNLEAIYVPGDKVNDFKAATGWNAYENIIKAIPAHTIYCKMEHGWWTADGAAIGIFAWDDNGTPKAAWPGERMTLVDGETNVWKFDLDVNKYKKCVFTRVNSDGDIEDWGAKTKDQTIPTDDKDMFTITSSTAVWGDLGCEGTWSKYVAELPTYAITIDDGNVDAANWEVDPTKQKAGETVKLTYKGKKKIKSITIEAAPILVTSITLNKTSTTISTGETETLSVTAVAPENATDKTYTWKSSDETKATVDQNGVVTAKAAGTVTIYAEANDGSGVKGECAVTVQAVLRSETITFSGGFSGTYFQVTGTEEESGILNVDKYNTMFISAKTGKTIVKVVFSYGYERDNKDTLSFSSGNFDGYATVNNVNATSLTVSSSNIPGIDFSGVTVYYYE